jgi:hypothetical protein
MAVPVNTVAGALNRMKTNPDGFQQLQAGEIERETLLAAYEKRVNGPISGSWRRGWTKEGKCEMIAKEAFEQLKRLKDTTANADQIRREIAKVLEDDVISVIGATNLSAMVNKRVDSTEEFHKIRLQSTDLKERFALQELGDQTPNVQLVNKLGQNHGNQTAGYESIKNMASSDVDRLLDELAKFEKEVKAVPATILKAMCFNDRLFYTNINLAKTQLKLRQERLKVIAKKLPEELLQFKRDAKALHGNSLIKNLPLIGWQAKPKAELDTKAQELKDNLDAVEGLFENITPEDRVRMQNQLEMLRVNGSSPRSKKAIATHLQEPMLTKTEFLTTVAIAVATAYFTGGTIASDTLIGKISETITSTAKEPIAYITSAVAWALMSYTRGGLMYELFDE